MRIHYLQTGNVQIKSLHQQAARVARAARMIDVLRDPNWSTLLPIACWLIEHPEGLILVDTGESSRSNFFRYQPRWHPFVQRCERRWVKPVEESGSQLSSLGLSPADVHRVVMTHMHGDHAGGIPNFAKSEFVLSAREAADALAWSGPVQGFLNMHYPKNFAPRRIDHSDGAWESFDRSTVLTADGRVRIVPTPGHTHGHQSVIVEQDDHLVLIAGDAAYNEAALLAGTVDGVAADYAAHKDSTRRLRALCQRRRVVTQFAHDHASPARLDACQATHVA